MNLKTILIILGSAVVLLSGCQSTTSSSLNTEKGMVKVTILYPKSEGTTFDLDYYSNKHMPMVAELLGESLKKYSIDAGISGRTPDDPMPYLAIGYLYFAKIEDYQNSFGPNAEQIVNDIPNYTNVQPVLQISEVVE